MSDYADPTPIATAEQFKRALLALRDRDGISPKELAMLRAHCRAPNHTINATKLAEETGMANHSVVNLQYGRFAHCLADCLRYDPTKREDGSTRWWFSLSFGRNGSGEKEDGHFDWIMRPELVQALLEMKWA